MSVKSSNDKRSPDSIIYLLAKELDKMEGGQERVQRITDEYGEHPILNVSESELLSAINSVEKSISISKELVAEGAQRMRDILEKRRNELANIKYCDQRIHEICADRYQTSEIVRRILPIEKEIDLLRLKFFWKASFLQPFLSKKEKERENR